MMNIKEIREIIHKINSPITTIIGFSELLLKREIGDKEKEWVEKIHKESHRLKDLVKELSDAIPKSSD